MDRLMNLKNIDPTDRLEIGLLILELLEPEDYEDYRRVLQKEHYRKRRRQAFNIAMWWNWQTHWSLTPDIISSSLIIAAN